MHQPSLLALCLTGLMLLGNAIAGPDIYSCVDGKGRTFTADRPIVECIDRTQRELSSSGTVKRRLGPTLTAHEQAAQLEKDKLAVEIREREIEGKRRDKALLQRYPTRAAHDSERAATLAQIDQIIRGYGKIKVNLADQRKSIADEFEFYLKDPTKAPASLKHKLQENEGSVLRQQKLIADQEQEKKRVNLHFDEELVKLKLLWEPKVRP